MISQSASSLDFRSPQSVTPPVFGLVSRAGGATQPHTAAITVNMPAGSVCYIQNLHATIELRVKLGEGASATSFDFTLPAGAATGLQAPLKIDNYVGPISTASSGAMSYTLSLLT